MLRDALLVDLLAIDAVGEALQMARTIPQRREHRAASDGAVVVDEPSLGAGRTQLREVHLVGIGQPDGDPVDVDFLRWRSHSPIPAQDSSTMG
jgi:hypothetical protein